LQLLINTLITASTIVLSAVSFRLVYVTAKFFHFAHALTITIGGYTAWVFIHYFALHPAAAFLCAIIVTGVIGALLFAIFLRPMMSRGATPLVLLLASLAIQLIFQHAIALIFGEDARSLWPSDEITVYSLGSAHFTVVHCWLVVLAASVTVSLWLFTSFSIFGKQQAAVAEHAELSTVFGINVLSIQVWVFMLASAIGGGLGILIGMDLSISPDMGFSWLLPGVVAVLVGGIWRIEYVVMAALIIACVRTAIIWYLGSAWQEVFVYAILFFYLFLRPQILMGYSE
jgi:branched-subunit amino acid ABC-type transport system permease component